MYFREMKKKYFEMRLCDSNKKWSNSNYERKHSSMYDRFNRIKITTEINRVYSHDRMINKVHDHDKTRIRIINNKLQSDETEMQTYLINTILSGLIWLL